MERFNTLKVERFLKHMVSEVQVPILDFAKCAFIMVIFVIVCKNKNGDRIISVTK